MLNKRKFLSLMIGIYAALDSAQTTDWIINYEPKRWEAALSVTKDFLLLFSALIIYSLGRTPQRLNVHVIRSSKPKMATEEKKNPPNRYSSFNERNDMPEYFEEPLSENSLNSAPIEIQTTIRSMPSL